MIYLLIILSVFANYKCDTVTDQAKIKQLVDFATASLDLPEASGLLRPTEVYSAQVQVVSGSKYNIVYGIAETSCDKTVTTYANTDIEACPYADVGVQRKCEAQIWEQPWRNLKKLVSLKCN
ncbi:Cystatin-1 [Halotydeus destructor]|nr:Cystatin-1 [Halotydeus destructor]